MIRQKYFSHNYLLGTYLCSALAVKPIISKLMIVQQFVAPHPYWSPWANLFFHLQGVTLRGVPTWGRDFHTHLLEGVCQKPLTLRWGTRFLWYKVIDWQSSQASCANSGCCALCQELFLPLPHWCQFVRKHCSSHPQNFLFWDQGIRPVFAFSNANISINTLLSIHNFCKFWSCFMPV